MGTHDTLQATVASILA